MPVLPLVPFLPSHRFNNNLVLLGQERAFPLHTITQHDKVYLSLRSKTQNPEEWHPVSFQPKTLQEAHDVTEAISAFIGGTPPLLARELLNAALAGTPVHLLQAHMPHDRGSYTRLKLYYKKEQQRAGVNAAVQHHIWTQFGKKLPLPFSNGAQIEMHGALFPNRESREAYSFEGNIIPYPTFLAPLLNLSALPCQVGCDAHGTKTWYCPLPADLTTQDALTALSKTTNTPLHPDALARFNAFLHNGWMWADIIVQQTAAGDLIPVVHLIDPYDDFLSFDI